MDPVKYWEGKQPPPEYYVSIDPYRESPSCPFDLSAIIQYAKASGKRLVDLTYEEINQFRN